MGTVGIYWRRAHQSAWREAWNWVFGHPRESILTGAAVILGVLALWWFGSVDGLRDQAILLTVGAATCFLSFLILYLSRLASIPPRWDRELSDRILCLDEAADRIVDAAKPTLRFEHDSSDQRHSEIVRMSSGRERLFGRVAVRNTAIAKSIQGVTVRLVAYRKLDGHHSTKTNILLECVAVGGAQVTIHGGEREFFDLVRAKTVNEGGALVLAPGDREKQVESGQYCIELVVAGQDVVPNKVSYLVRLEGGQIKMTETDSEIAALV